MLTPQKHTAHHNTIPNSATYIHLYTPTHRNTPTVATLFFSLPLITPHNGSWWYWQHDGTPQQALKINTHPTTAQQTNLHPVTLVISESQFTSLMEDCFDQIVYFSMIYTTIWYFLSVNSQLIFTLAHGLAQASNIHTSSSDMVCPPRFYFFNLVPILCTSIIPIQEPYFFPYMVLNTNITLKTNVSILSNTIAKFISPNHHARKTSTTLVRFLHILQLRCIQVTQLSGFYLRKKELWWTFCTNKFFLLITSPKVLSWQVHLG